MLSFSSNLPSPGIATLRSSGLITKHLTYNTSGAPWEDHKEKLRVLNKRSPFTLGGADLAEVPAGEEIVWICHA